MSQIDHSLDSVLKLIPKRYLQANGVIATAYIMGLLGVAIAMLGLSSIVWQKEWVLLYPITWILLGTAFGSFFFVAHDCAHYSFYRSRWVNIVVGHLAILPSAYPFFSWKFAHDAHHRHTNNRRLDPFSNDWDMAWYPFSIGQYQHLKTTAPLRAWFYRVLRTFIAIGAIFYNLRYNYGLTSFKPSQKSKVLASIIVSVVAQIGGCAIIWSVTASWGAVFHFWILPVLVCNAWIAIHTFVQHTAEDSVYYEPSKWTPYKGQVKGTINCYFPKWLSFWHCNIDIHIPHHVTVRIPGYYLRRANAILLASQYGKDMRERQLTVSYFVRQIRNCRLWNPAHSRFEGRF